MVSRFDPLPEETARLLEDAAAQASARGDWAEAERSYLEARDAYGRRGSPREAVCLLRLGEAALQRGDPSAARSALRQAWQVARSSTGDRPGDYGVWDQWGFWESHLHGRERSPEGEVREELRAACAGAQAAPGLADPAGVYAEAVIATHEEEAGERAIDEGDWDEADRRYQAARPSYAAIGSPREAVCLLRFGESALLRGDPAAAQRHAAEALRVLDVLGARGIHQDFHLAARCILTLADAQAQSLLYDDAERSYERAFEGFQRSGDLLNVGRCLLGMGELARRRSDPATARERFEQARRALTRSLEQEQARARAEQPEDRGSLTAVWEADPRVVEALQTATHGLGLVKLDLAQAELDEGAFERAWRATSDALDDLRAVDDVAAQAVCLHLRATILARLGDADGTIRNLREAMEAFIIAGDEDRAQNVMASLVAMGVDPVSP
jgi:tetratricopeptide (TPR) repeat protein